MFNGHRVSIGQDEKVLEMDSHSSGDAGQFHVICFYQTQENPTSSVCGGRRARCPSAWRGPAGRETRGSRMPGGPAPRAGPAHLGRPRLPRAGLGREAAAPQESKVCACAQEGRAGTAQTTPPGGGHVLCPVPGRGRRRGARRRRPSTINQASPRAAGQRGADLPAGPPTLKEDREGGRPRPVNAGNGVADGAGGPDISDGRDSKAAGHPGEDGVGSASHGEGKGA